MSCHGRLVPLLGWFGIMFLCSYVYMVTCVDGANRGQVSLCLFTARGAFCVCVYHCHAKRPQLPLCAISECMLCVNKKPRNKKTMPRIKKAKPRIKKARLPFVSWRRLFPDAVSLLVSFVSWCRLFAGVVCFLAPFVSWCRLFAGVVCLLLSCVFSS